MSVNKKYFYLKLKDNFFDTDEMIILESMPDGYKYSNILLKLYLRSIRNEGRLMVNDRIPFNATMLASVTRHSVGDIEKAVKVFKDIGLIEVLDNGAIYMSDIQNFIGHSSSEAERKKEYRLKISTESGTLSQKCPDIRPPEIELELDTELEIDIEHKKEKRKRTSSKALVVVDLPECINSNIWDTWIQYRKDRRLTVVKSTLNTQINKLEEWFNEGYDPNEIINTSISNGWQGLFKPKELPLKALQTQSNVPANEQPWQRKKREEIELREKMKPMFESGLNIFDIIGRE